MNGESTISWRNGCLDTTINFLPHFWHEQYSYNVAFSLGTLIIIKLTNIGCEIYLSLVWPTLKQYIHFVNEKNLSPYLLESPQNFNLIYQTKKRRFKMRSRMTEKCVTMKKWFKRTIIFNFLHLWDLNILCFLL